jgi:hypothetical protein
MAKETWPCPPPPVGEDRAARALRRPLTEIESRLPVTRQSKYLALCLVLSELRVGTVPRI